MVVVSPWSAACSSAEITAPVSRSIACSGLYARCVRPSFSLAILASGSVGLCRMAKKPDEYVRKVVRLPAATWREIDDYRHEEWFRTETEAIGHLILTGLRAWQRADQAKSPGKRKP